MSHLYFEGIVIEVMNFVFKDAETINMSLTKSELLHHDHMVRSAYPVVLI